VSKKSKSLQSGDASLESKTGKAVSRSRSTRNKKTKIGSEPKATARKAKTAKRQKSSGISSPTDEEIRIRAYFIAERRSRLALPGDSSSDWLEAKRQLLSEVGPR
jgi:hypothetical protein